MPTPLKKTLPRRPSESERATATEAWARGDYEGLLELLEGRHDAGAQLLRARALLRLRRYAAVIDGLRTEGVRDPNDAALIGMMRATAARRLGRDDIAFPDLPARPTRDVMAAHAYYTALGHWMAGDVAAAEDAANEALARGDSPVRVLATELLAFIALQRQDVTAAVERFLETLDTIALPGRTDQGLRAAVLRGLSLSMLEALDFTHAEKIFAEHATLVPSAGFGRQALKFSTNVAAAREWLGADDLAFETLLAARSIAAPEPFVADVDVELARFHRRRGSIDAAQRHLDLARRRIDAADWRGIDSEAHVLLLLYASEASTLQPESAGAAIAKAVSLTGRRDLSLAFERNQLMLAAALAARGRLSWSRQRTNDAVCDLRRSFDLFAELGQRRQAAFVALDLVRFSGRLDPAPAALLSEVVRAFPNSLFSVEVKKAKADLASPFSRITAAERRVLEKICEGKTSREIAAELQRSPSTVRNQTISIFRALGVKTRAGLVALVAAETGAGNPFVSRSGQRARAKRGPAARAKTVSG